MKYIIWALLWLPLFIIGIVFRILSPFVVCFVKREPYTTTVKRYGRQTLTLQRDRLVWWLSWFDTFDNATDEYWYGLYDTKSAWTQSDYDNSKIIRWYCRMMWLQRNSAYGLMNTKWLTLAKDSKLAWQYQGNSLIKGRTINCGWKAHKGFDRLMYAGRIF